MERMMAKDRLLVEPDDAEEVSPGGIVIPDAAKEKPVVGVVIMAGEGFMNERGIQIPQDYAKGDRVYYSKYSGTPVKLDGTDYLILVPDDVLMVERE